MTAPASRSSGTLALAAVVLATLLSSCGGSDDNLTPAQETRAKGPAVVATLKEYFTDVIEHRGERACALLTQSQQKAVAAQSPQDEDCVQYLNNFFPRDKGKAFFTIGNRKVFEEDIQDLTLIVKVTGDRAVARPQGGSGRFDFTKVDGEWKISDLGIGG